MTEQKPQPTRPAQPANVGPDRSREKASIDRTAVHTPERLIIKK